MVAKKSKSLRPKLDDTNIPPKVLDLAKRCWVDARDGVAGIALDHKHSGER